MTAVESHGLLLFLVPVEFGHPQCGSARFRPVPAGSDNSACHQGAVSESARIRWLTGAIGHAEVERVERNTSPCRSNSCAQVDPGSCFTWNTRYEIHRVERASSNDCSASEEWALCRDSHPPRIPIRCRTDLAEELVAKPIVEAHTGQRRKAEVGQARRWPT